MLELIDDLDMPNTLFCCKKIYQSIKKKKIYFDLYGLIVNGINKNRY